MMENKRGEVLRSDMLAALVGIGYTWQSQIGQKILLASEAMLNTLFLCFVKKRALAPHLFLYGLTHVKSWPL